MEDDAENESDVRAAPPSDLHTFTPQELKCVADFVYEAGPDLFRQILQSICPSIYGHELVKGQFSSSLKRVGLVECAHFKRHDVVIGAQISNYVSPKVVLKSLATEFSGH